MLANGWFQRGFKFPPEVKRMLERQRSQRILYESSFPDWDENDDPYRYPEELEDWGLSPMDFGDS